MSAIALYGLIPLVGIIAALLLSNFTSSGSSLLYYIYAFVAGAIIAVISVELVPDLIKVTDKTSRIAILIGFVLGAISSLLLRSYIRKRRDNDNVQTELILSVGIDLLINSVFIGLVINIGSRISYSLAAILVMEIIILTLGLIERYKKKQIDGRVLSGILLLLISVVAFGLFLGYRLGVDFHQTPLYYGLVSFGLSGLLWLVFEELFFSVANNSKINQNLSIGLLFTGFLTIIISNWVTPG